MDGARSPESMGNRRPSAVATGTQFYHIYVMGRDDTHDDRDWRLSRGVTSSFLKAFIKRCVRAGQVHTHGIWDTHLVVILVFVREINYICIAHTNLSVLSSIVLGNYGTQAV